MSGVCIVSGCSRGIGKAIAMKLAPSYSLGLLARSENELYKLKEEIANQGNRYCVVKCDVQDENSIKNAVHEVAATLGNPVGLVNIAGINKDGLAIRYKTDDMQNVIQTNLMGTMLMTRAVLPYMMKQKKGSIVTIGSIVGEGGRIGQSVYAASKSGLIGYSRSIAKEMGRYHIRSNVIEPGFIASQMTDQSIKDETELLKRIALGRIGKPEEVANAVEFLLSDYASYITGGVRVLLSVLVIGFKS